jgi:hypothetical protein
MIEFDDEFLLHREYGNYNHINWNDSVMYNTK